MIKSLIRLIIVCIIYIYNQNSIHINHFEVRRRLESRNITVTESTSIGTRSVPQRNSSVTTSGRKGVRAALPAQMTDSDILIRRPWDRVGLETAMTFPAQSASLAAGMLLFRPWMKATLSLVVVIGRNGLCIS